MSYLTLKEASEATGLNVATIRRLCKKAESKPFIQMKEGKQGTMYTIQANYLFDVYPPIEPDNTDAYTRVNNGSTSLDKEPVQGYIALLSAKDEIIQLLKSETAYLRAENTSLREENREMKLLPAPVSAAESQPAASEFEQAPEQSRKSFWRRFFN